VYLDFAAPAKMAPVSGYLLCLAGLAVASAIGTSFSGLLAERERLDAKLGTVSRPHRGGRTSDPSAAAADAELRAATSALAIPWTALLTELESASQDMAAQVSILQVQPDPVKRVVRITAEVRSLPDALAYLQRLQQSRLLRYPMLESHERRKDDPQQPLRIILSAEWRS
jgi:hypothetical protein